MNPLVRHCYTIFLCCLAIFIGGFPLHADASENEIEKEKVQAVLNQWMRGINQKNLSTLMATYDAAFESDGLDYALKKKELQQHFNISPNLSTKIYHPEITVTDDQAHIRFVQLTRTVQLSDIGRKSMTLNKKKEEWKIRSESFEVLVGYLRLSPEDKIDLSLTDLNSSPEDDRSDNTGFSIRSNEYLLTVKGIKYQLVKKGVESVCIESDRRFTPVVEGVEGEQPKIIIDLLSVDDFKGPQQAPLKTDLIRHIRTNYDSIDDTLQIVLNIASGDNYTVEPVYYEKLNTFCLAVKAPGEPSLHRTDKPKPTTTIEKPE